MGDIQPDPQSCGMLLFAASLRHFAPTQLQAFNCSVAVAYLVLNDPVY